MISLINLDKVFKRTMTNIQYMSTIVDTLVLIGVDLGASKCEASYYSQQLITNELTISCTESPLC